MPMPTIISMRLNPSGLRVNRILAMAFALVRPDDTGGCVVMLQRGPFTGRAPEHLHLHDAAGLRRGIHQQQWVVDHDDRWTSVGAGEPGLHHGRESGVSETRHRAVVACLEMRW